MPDRAAIVTNLLFINITSIDLQMNHKESVKNIKYQYNLYDTYDETKLQL